jgi:hypothetical protein
MTKLIALSLSLLCSCVDDDTAPSDASSSVELYKYELDTHASCNGEHDVVLTMCFPAGQADAVEPGDAAAAAYAQMWLATCDVDHGVLDGVGETHPGWCPNASDTGEDTWACSLHYAPSFEVCN